MEKWSIDQVSAWVRGKSLGKSLIKFVTEARIDGAVLRLCTESDLKELGLKSGRKIRLLLEARDALMVEFAEASEDEDEPTSSSSETTSEYDSLEGIGSPPSAPSPSPNDPLPPPPKLTNVPVLFDPTAPLPVSITVDRVLCLSARSDDLPSPVSQEPVRRKTFAHGKYVGHLKGDARHGEGTMSYREGLAIVQYKGSWQNNEKHGFGTLLMADGAQYIGDWDHGYRCGSGTLMLPSGDLYKGEWENNLRHGRGTYFWVAGSRNGSKLEAEWRHDVPVRGIKHVCQDTQPVCTYSGDFDAGVPHGTGTLEVEDGFAWDGQWMEGTPIEAPEEVRDVLEELSHLHPLGEWGVLTGELEEGSGDEEVIELPQQDQFPSPPIWKDVNAGELLLRAHPKRFEARDFKILVVGPPSRLADIFTDRSVASRPASPFQRLLNSPASMGGNVMSPRGGGGGGGLSMSMHMSPNALPMAKQVKTKTSDSDLGFHTKTHTLTRFIRYWAEQTKLIPSLTGRSDTVVNTVFCHGVNVRISVHNTAGFETLPNLRAGLYAGTDCLVAVFSVLDEETLNEAGTAIREARIALSEDSRFVQCPVILVGVHSAERDDPPRPLPQRCTPVTSAMGHDKAIKWACSAYFELDLRRCPPAAVEEVFVHAVLAALGAQEHRLLDKMTAQQMAGSTIVRSGKGAVLTRRKMAALSDVAVPQDVWDRIQSWNTADHQPKPVHTGPRVFGVMPARLDAQYLDGDTGIPRVLLQCMQLLDNERALCAEGLFRLSGDTARINAIRSLFETGAPEAEAALSQETNVHNVSALFKQYFMQLPEPFVPYDVYDDFLSVLDVQEEDPEATDRIVAVLQSVVHRLPECVHAILTETCAFLRKVMHYSHTNKMHAGNLGVVFGGSLMRMPSSSTDPMAAMALAGKQSAAMALLLEHSAVVLPPRDREEKALILPSAHGVAVESGSDRNVTQLPPLADMAVPSGSRRWYMDHIALQPHCIWVGDCKALNGPVVLCMENEPRSPGATYACILFTARGQERFLCESSVSTDALKCALSYYGDPLKKVRWRDADPADVVPVLLQWERLQQRSPSALTASLVYAQDAQTDSEWFTNTPSPAFMDFVQWLVDGSPLVPLPDTPASSDKTDHWVVLAQGWVRNEPVPIVLSTAATLGGAVSEPRVRRNSYASGSALIPSRLMQELRALRGGQRSNTMSDGLVALVTKGGGANAAADATAPPSEPAPGSTGPPPPASRRRPKRGSGSHDSLTTPERKHRGGSYKGLPPKGRMGKQPGKAAPRKQPGKVVKGAGKKAAGARWNKSPPGPRLAKRKAGGKKFGAKKIPGGWKKSPGGAKKSPVKKRFAGGKKFAVGAKKRPMKKGQGSPKRGPFAGKKAAKKVLRPPPMRSVPEEEEADEGVGQLAEAVDQGHEDQPPASSEDQPPAAPEDQPPAASSTPTTPTQSRRRVVKMNDSKRVVRRRAVTSRRIKSTSKLPMAASLGAPGSSGSKARPARHAPVPLNDWQQARKQAVSTARVAIIFKEGESPLDPLYAVRDREAHAFIVVQPEPSGSALAAPRYRIAVAVRSNVAELPTLVTPLLPHPAVLGQSPALRTWILSKAAGIANAVHLALDAQSVRAAGANLLLQAVESVGASQAHPASELTRPNPVWWHPEAMTRVGAVASVLPKASYRLLLAGAVPAWATALKAHSGLTLRDAPFGGPTVGSGQAESLVAASQRAHAEHAHVNPLVLMANYWAHGVRAPTQDPASAGVCRPRFVNGAVTYVHVSHTADYEAFMIDRATTYSHFDAIMVTFSVLDPASFETAKHIMSTAREESPSVGLALLGLHAEARDRVDASDSEVVRADDVTEACHANNVFAYYEVDIACCDMPAFDGIIQTTIDSLHWTMLQSMGRSKLKKDSRNRVILFKG